MNLLLAVVFTMALPFFGMVSENIYSDPVSPWPLDYRNEDITPDNISGIWFTCDEFAQCWSLTIWFNSESKTYDWIIESLNPPNVTMSGSLLEKDRHLIGVVGLPAEPPRVVTISLQKDRLIFKIGTESEEPAVLSLNRSWVDGSLVIDSQD